MHHEPMAVEPPPPDMTGLGLFAPSIPPNGPGMPPHIDKITTDPHELDKLELAEATPRTSMLCSDPLSPRQQETRRASGRRPLSIISNSSMNSDLSPSENRSPDLFSPSRHRRHRSVIGASVDYRHHPYQGSYYQYPYGNPFQSPQPSCNPSSFNAPSFSAQQMNQQMSQQMGAQQMSAQQISAQQMSAQFNAPHFGPQLNAQQPSQHFGSQPPFNAPSFSYGPHSEPTVLRHRSESHAPDSPFVSEIPAALSVAAAAAATSNGIQDIFVALAYKERQVLEARQIWEAAKEDLESFRRQLDSMLAPEPEPLMLPVRPSIISRRPVPNLGINSLQCSPATQSTPRRSAPRVAVWRIDCEVPSPAQPADLDDITDIDELLDRENAAIESKRRGMAFAVVNCLLDIVNCIISTLPVHQRDFKHRTVQWTPQYPMPMDALFGHLA